MGIVCLALIFIIFSSFSKEIDIYLANKYKNKEITLAEALSALNMNRSSFYKNLKSNFF